MVQASLPAAAALAVTVPGVGVPGFGVWASTPTQTRTPIRVAATVATRMMVTRRRMRCSRAAWACWAASCWRRLPDGGVDAGGGVVLGMGVSFRLAWVRAVARGPVLDALTPRQRGGTASTREALEPRAVAHRLARDGGRWWQSAQQKKPGRTPPAERSPRGHATKVWNPGRAKPRGSGTDWHRQRGACHMRPAQPGAGTAQQHPERHTEADNVSSSPEQGQPQRGQTEG